MFKWRIYYEDGSTFSNADGEPEDSPAWGSVIVRDKDKLLMGRNADYFLYDKKLKCWHQAGEREDEGSVSVALIDHLAHNVHNISCVRPARWVASDEAFKKICARALGDRDG